MDEKQSNDIREEIGGVTPVISGEIGATEGDIDRAKANAELISAMADSRGGSSYHESEETPVKRTDVKDIDMELTGKIIPQTEAFPKVTDIPNDLSYDERSQMLREQRSDRVDAFRLKRDRDEDEDVRAAVHRHLHTAHHAGERLFAAARDDLRQDREPLDVHVHKYDTRHHLHSGELHGDS